MGFFAELRRRNVFRVGAGYLVLAWLVIQVTDAVAPALRMPDWTMTVVVWFGILGFPFALFFAWAFELTPEGIKLEKNVERAQSITPATGRKIDFIIIGLLAAALVVVVVKEYVIGDVTGSHERVASESSQAESQAVKSYDSIAVLPFINMSDDPEQTYLSDGLAEELLNLLARIRGLKVAARTSSFAFRGEEQDIRQIGTALNVNTILEGSVRKSGARIRITAQLIDAENGFHLWSETFDRELTDIFQIQDDISASIVRALRGHLVTGSEPGAVTRTDNFSAYEYYLKGRHKLRQAGEGAVRAALELFRQATEADPGFAPAWAGRAMAVVFLRETQFWGEIPAAEAFALAESNIERALTLDPDLAEAYVAQSVLHWDRYEFDEALAAVDRAIAINPNLASAYPERASVLRTLGRIREAREALLTAAELDPLDDSILMRAINLVSVYPDDAFTNAIERRIDKRTGDGLSPDQLDLKEWLTLVRYGQTELNLARRYQRFAAAAQSSAANTVTRRRFEGMRDQVALKLNQTPEALRARISANPVFRFLSMVGFESKEQLAQELFDQLPSKSQAVPIVLEELSILQAKRGECEAALMTLERAHGGRVPIYGQVPPNQLRSNSNLAMNRVHCLKLLGRDDEAASIHAEVGAFVRSLAESTDRGYEMLDAKLQVIEEDRSGALDTLERAVRRRDLDAQHLIDPVLLSLKDEPRFLALKQWLTTTIDAERAELGWPPAHF